MDSNELSSVASGFVAIVGPANSGKSTLLNACVGRKVSIVSRKPQTTRNRILGVMNTPVAQIVFVDTPGFLSVRDKGLLGKALEKTLTDASQDVDVTVLVLDVYRLLKDNEHLGHLHARWIKFGLGHPDIVVLNKIDTVDSKQSLPLIAQVDELFNGGEGHERADIIPLSALKGNGIDDFASCVSSRLPQGVRMFPEGMVTDQPEEFFVAELIREKIYGRLHKEIPYSTAIRVESIEEYNDVVHIHASILVERASQKTIVVGAGGATVKAVGIQARKDLEKLYGMQVNLKLFVRIEASWTHSQKGMSKAGY